MKKDAKVQTLMVIAKSFIQPSFYLVFNPPDTSEQPDLPIAADPASSGDYEPKKPLPLLGFFLMGIVAQQ